MSKESETSHDINMEECIHTLRGHRVILAADLAVFFGVSTKRLNEQVKRNLERFPADFMFQLNEEEAESLRSQIATSKIGRGGQRYLPYAFTEHGAVMAANVLNSTIAIQASIIVVRVFLRMRQALSQNLELKKRLTQIEHRLEKGFAQHEQELREIRYLIALLEKPIEPKKSRIGFYKD